MEINFGKYKGKTLNEIFELDPNYCKWLSNQQMLLDQNPEIESILKEKLEYADMSYRMRWGKYKNRSINSIQQTNPEYIEWLLKNKFVADKCKKLLSELKALV